MRASDATGGAAATRDMPLVSVIVPFYNLQDCVGYCLDSLAAQTYANIEVVCIDDGSADETPALLDERARRDGRIRVLHVPNGGLSAARNLGVRESRGEIVTFVDGDDVLAPCGVEVLVKALKSSGCELVVAGLVPVKASDVVGGLGGLPFGGSGSGSGFGSGPDPKPEPDPAPESSSPFQPSDLDIRILDPREAVRALLYETISESACARAFTRRLIERHPFPEQRFYEDTAWAGRLFLDAGSVAVLDGAIYGYVMRAGSIVHRRRASIGQAHDFLWAIEQMMGPLLDAYPDLARPAAFRFCLEYARLHALLCAVEPRDQAKRLDDWVIEQVGDLFPIVAADGNVPVAYKIRFGLLKSAPRAYDRAFELYERVWKGVQ